MWGTDLLLSGFVQTAHAQDSLSSVANFVSNGLVAFFSGDGEGGGGAEAYAGIAGFLLERTWLIVAAFTLLLLVRSGLKLIYGQGEDKFEEAKRAIANGLMAVVLVFLTSRLVSAFIRAGGSWNPEGGSAIFTEELLGIVRWVHVLVAVLAIAMIIAAVFAAVFSVGSDNATDRIKRAVFGAAAGIFILGIDVAFRATFDLEYFTVPGDPSPYPAITRALIVIGYVLTFMALIAVIIVIYAGIRMILSLGEEDTFKNMRSLIVRTLIGLFVILTSYIIVKLVIAAFSG
jgi:uncharacterized BrkB/YihY/UPF0761 family membrane protein